jgi:hypothetical protein
MLPISVAIIALVIILVGLLIQPSLVLIVVVYMSYTLWGIYQVGGPRESLERLIIAVQEADEETVRSLVSEDAQASIDVLFRSFSRESSFGFMRLFEGAEITQCSLVDTETATCTLCMESDDNCQDFTINKENDRWVVDFDK